MNDTPDYIIKKQFDIIYNRPISEKIRSLFEMTELSRNIILNQLRLKNPGMSKVDLQIELFRVFYREDFSPEKLDRIAQQMREYLMSGQ